MTSSIHPSNWFTCLWVVKFSDYQNYFGDVPVSVWIWVSLNVFRYLKPVSNGFSSWYLWTMYIKKIIVKNNLNTKYGKIIFDSCYFFLGGGEAYHWIEKIKNNTSHDFINLLISLGNSQIISHWQSYNPQKASPLQFYVELW